jgi:hypothetical protein
MPKNSVTAIRHSTTGVESRGHEFAKETQRGDSVGGRVTHDPRGTAVWDWAVATGVLAGSKRADLLQMLDNPMLELADEPELAAGWQGDPYNRR